MALEPVVPPGPARAEWVCPMHPEIVRDAPGSCPICGMALEPRVPSGDQEENHELRDMSRRFWFATALSVPILLIAMGHLVPGDPIARLLPSARTRTLLELLFATPVCRWAAWPFYVRAVQSVRNRSLNMFTLIGLGVSVAYVYSLVAALFPGAFPASFRSSEGAVGVYFEAAAVIVTLILLGQVLELRARASTGAAIRKLLGLAAKSAFGRMAPRRTWGSRPSPWGTGCVSDPARRCRWTVSCWRERASSTSRWSPASPSRSRSTPATPSWVQR
jgi:Cu+-exporting ATPase